MKKSMATVALGGNPSARSSKRSPRRISTASRSSSRTCAPTRARRATSDGIAAGLGLTIDLFQPLRDFEGVPDSEFRANLERAEAAFDVMGELDASLSSRVLERRRERLRRCRAHGDAALRARGARVAARDARSATKRSPGASTFSASIRRMRSSSARITQSGTRPRQLSHARASGRLVVDRDLPARKDLLPAARGCAADGCRSADVAAESFAHAGAGRPRRCRVPARRAGHRIRGQPLHRNLQRADQRTPRPRRRAPG